MQIGGGVPGVPQSHVRARSAHSLSGGAVPEAVPPAKIHLTFSQNSTVEAQAGGESAGHQTPALYTYQVEKANALDIRYGKPAGTHFRGMIADGDVLKAVFSAPEHVKAERKKFMRLTATELRRIEQTPPQPIEQCIPELKSAGPQPKFTEQPFCANGPQDFETMHEREMQQRAREAAEHSFATRQSEPGLFGNYPHCPAPTAEPVTVKTPPPNMLLRAGLVGAGALTVIAVAAWIYQSVRSRRAKKALAAYGGADW